MICSFLLATTPVTPAPLPADVASIDASCRVAAVRLPERGSGRRELVHAFGRDAEAVMRDRVEGALSDLRAFASLGGESADYVLDLDVAGARLESDAPGTPADRKPLSLALTVRWTWGLPGGSSLTGETTVQEVRVVNGAATREDLATVARAALDEAVRRAFTAIYETK